MSVVFTAITAGTVVSSGVSLLGAKASSKAAGRGAADAARATLESTRMQTDEIRRQFDYQQRILLPQVQQQYNAQRAYSDLLGINGPDGDEDTFFDSNATPRQPGGSQEGTDGNTIQGPRFSQQQPAAPRQKSEREQEIEARIAGIQQAFDTPGAFGNGGRQTALRMESRQGEMERLKAELSTIQEPFIAAEAARTGTRIGAPGSSGLRQPAPGQTSRFRDPTKGSFRDPNLDPTSLAESSTYADTVRGNLLAPTDAAGDEYRGYIDNNRIASANPNDNALVARARDVTMTGMRGGVPGMTATRGGDSLAAGAAGRGVYGETFEASPGYSFSREEMERQLERTGSAGGPNIGGRAIMEAQRRAKGLADQEYYNWASGRTNDLNRLAGAEATDANRRDSFAEYDLNRGDSFAETDLNRGDTALGNWENQRVTDVGRGDEAYQNYLQRRAGDVQRLDSAASDTDRLTAADLQRKDQGYYNYMAALREQAGFGGGPAAQAVSGSQAAGSQVAGAYATQGGRLSGIYGDLGTSRANIQGDAWRAGGTAVNTGINNYLSVRAYRGTL